MGISLKEQRRRGRRRSYADYRPPERNPRPSNDPLRIVVYMLLIGVGIWAYFNQDIVRSLLTGQPIPDETASVAGGETAALVTRQAPVQTSTGPSAESLAAQAAEAYDNGQLSDSIDLYAQASALDPSTVSYSVEQARLLIYRSALEYGDQRDASLQAAIDAANQATLNAPFDPSGFAILGKAYDWQGRPDQAQSTIARALELDSSYALGQSYLAEAQVDLDRWDQAQETIGKALEMAPDSIDVRRDYGYILERLGDYASAATQYEAALQLNANLAFLRVALARAYRVEGNYTGALDQLFAAQVTEPNNPIIAFEIGRTYETYIGNPTEAINNYQQATDMDPSYPLPWLRLGTLRYFQGRYPDAISAFERSLALNTETLDLLYQLGLSYAYQGRCDTAIRYLDQAYNQSEGDQRILDAVATGYEICAQPTPLPLPTATPESGG